MIDLTLNSLLVPDILGYDPPFGSKITTTPENKGGLSTRQVNDNILLPFAKQRAVIVEQSDTTSNVEYDAKIILKGETTELTIGKASYEGCHISVTSVVDNASITINDNENIVVGKGICKDFFYVNNKWECSSPVSTRKLLSTYTASTTVTLEPGWYMVDVVGGGGGGGHGADSYGEK